MPTTSEHMECVPGICSKGHADADLTLAYYLQGYQVVRTFLSRANHSLESKLGPRGLSLASNVLRTSRTSSKVGVN
jgi:hypothetical protein